MTLKPITLMIHAATHRKESPTGPSTPEEECYVPIFFDPSHTPRSKEEVQHWINSFISEDKRHLWYPTLLPTPKD